MVKPVTTQDVQDAIDALAEIQEQEFHNLRAERKKGIDKNRSYTSGEEGTTDLYDRNISLQYGVLALTQQRVSKTFIARDEDTGDLEAFALVDKHGGGLIAVGNWTVTLISSEAPIYRKLSGCKMGDVTPVGLIVSTFGSPVLNADEQQKAVNIHKEETERKILVQRQRAEEGKQEEGRLAQVRLRCQHETRIKSKIAEYRRRLQQDKKQLAEFPELEKYHPIWGKAWKVQAYFHEQKLSSIDDLDRFEQELETACPEELENLQPMRDEANGLKSRQEQRLREQARLQREQRLEQEDREREQRLSERSAKVREEQRQRKKQVAEHKETAKEDIPTITYQQASQGLDEIKLCLWENTSVEIILQCAKSLREQCELERVRASSSKPIATSPQQVQSSSGGGAVTGAVIGGILGMLGGPFGIMVGAAVGGFFGGVTDGSDASSSSAAPPSSSTFSTERDKWANLIKEIDDFASKLPNR